MTNNVKWVIQANLKPETVKRIEKIVNRPICRCFDRYINQALDKLEELQKINSFSNQYSGNSYSGVTLRGKCKT